MENPFLDQSPMNLPLRLNLCQKIHWTALRMATKGPYPNTIPENLNLDQLKDACRRIGYEACLLHPDYIEKIFSGFRLAHFKTVETLYCSRLELSIKMVYLILAKMAKEAKQPSMSYESIWALCLFLEKKRQENIAVKLTRTDSIWQLVILNPESMLKKEGGDPFPPKIICIVDIEMSKMLAYHIMDCNDNDIDEGVRVTIYNALISMRSPAALAPSGLEWCVPNQFYTDIDLGCILNNILKKHLQIHVESKMGGSRFLDVLQGNWEEDLSERVIRFEHFDRVFDNYLYRIHGYGPKRALAKFTQEYRPLIGYSADPAEVFPALRLLLSKHKAIISPKGEIVFDGLHFTHPFLKYWSGQQVTLRRSIHTESTVWVYLDGEILCEAKARELRKADGTYRKTKYRSRWEK